MAQRRLTKKSSQFPARRTLLAIFGASLLLAGCNQLSLLDTLGTQGEGGPLTLEPSSATVVKNGSIAFVARGGDMPHRFELVSGLGSINPDTGVYTAPSVSPSTASIRVLDDSGATQSATITVSGSTTGLTISPAVVTVPPGGQVNFVASGGTGSYTFSLTGTGSGSPSVGSTDGVYVAGSSLGTDTVELFDGTTTVSATITVSSASTDVDYAVTPAAFPATGTAGQPLSAVGAFQVDNLGTSNGGDTLYWYVYLSQGATLGPGAYLVDQGSLAPIDASGSVFVDVDGAWPTFTGPANFFVRVFAQDDSATANNETGAVATTLEAADVDYVPSAISLTSTDVLGSSFTGTFDLANQPITPPGDDGTQTIYWSVYLSLDGTFDDTVDVMVDSGTETPLPTTGATTVGFGGDWTIQATTLFVLVSAADDADTSNDELSTGVVISDPDVEYSVTSVTNTGGTTAGEELTGDFTVQHNGADAGTEPVYWTAYVSTDTLLDGADTVVDAGSISGLPAGGTSSPSFEGTWPTSPLPPTTFYLIVDIANAEDTTPGDDLLAGTGVSVVGRNVAYEVQAPSMIGGSSVAGEAFTGSFDIQNNGADDGQATVSWTAYVSDDATYDAGDSPVDSGSAAAIASGGSTTVNFSGYWPPVGGTSYWLIARISSTETPTVAEAVGVANPVSVPAVDYSVFNVLVTSAGPHPGNAVDGTFDIEQGGTDNGNQTVTWAAYVSLDGTLSSGDILMDGGTLAPLASAGGTTVPFSGSSPLRYGDYFVVIEISAGDDGASANNEDATVSTFTVGRYDEVASENNNDDTAPFGDGNPASTGVFNTGLVFEPGMRVEFTGNTSTPAGDPWDIFEFNTGTANTLTFSWIVDSGQFDLDLYLYHDDGTVLYSDAAAADVSWLFAEWVVDAPGVLRYLDLTNFSAPADIPGYRLLVTAE